jgi:predicted regulator of Ras-like GTPase activity (Roadblock/LC7/MglB family)
LKYALYCTLYLSVERPHTMATAPQQQQHQQHEESTVAHANLLELNETVSRISSHEGVESVQILNKAGDILAESGSSSSPPKQAALTKKLLASAANYLQALDADDEVAFLQIRSKGGRELMIAPHQGFALVVLKR